MVGPEKGGWVNGRWALRAPPVTVPPNRSSHESFSTLKMLNWTLLANEIFPFLGQPRYFAVLATHQGNLLEQKQSPSSRSVRRVGQLWMAITFFAFVDMSP